MSSEAPQPPRSGLRLGRNRGGYFGERIDVEKLLPALHASAKKAGWNEEAITCPDSRRLSVLHRTFANARGNIYLSAGIHGDEPAGPLALQQLIEEDRWPDRFNYWVLPCLNPVGFERNTREGEQGIDLNRDYLNPKTPTVQGHIQWLTHQPTFDLALLLHEDWEANGFYLYELNPDRHPSVAEEMIAAVRSVCPIEHAEEVDGRPAEGGMIRFLGNIPERSEWPEALHLIYHKTRLNYTLEGPSDYPLEIRVQALATAVRAALTHFQPRS